MASYDPLREALEVREQLASAERRLAFFFGAGTSMSVGLPGISELTEKVEKSLEEPYRSTFLSVKADLQTASPNVEHMLDHIRICRELFGDSEDKVFGCLKGATAARELDREVCLAIRNIVVGDPPMEAKPHMIFAQWLQSLRSLRDWPVEIFTTNYDLLFEKAMEDCAVPFFDGFIGSVAPFFAPESVESELAKYSQYDYPPKTWTRFWKLHGSINWYFAKTTKQTISRIARSSGSDVPAGSELVIFPSRDKYTESRKLPFLAFQDRLRKYLSHGACLIIILGYSFSDQHLNEIIFQGLRSNPELSVTVFTFTPLPEQLLRLSQHLRNITIYGTDRASIGGVIAPWSEPSKIQMEGGLQLFWDTAKKLFVLGNFDSFSSFLERFIGFRPASMGMNKIDGAPMKTSGPHKEDASK